MVTRTRRFRAELRRAIIPPLVLCCKLCRRSESQSCPFSATPHLASIEASSCSQVASKSHARFPRPSFPMTFLLPCTVSPFLWCTCVVHTCLLPWYRFVILHGTSYMLASMSSHLCPVFTHACVSSYPPCEVSRQGLPHRRQRRRCQKALQPRRPRTTSDCRRTRLRPNDVAWMSVARIPLRSCLWKKLDKEKCI